MAIKTTSSKINPEQHEVLLSTLKQRFDEHPERHRGVAWYKVMAKLESQPARLVSLFEMERTGGEPDVIGYDKKSDEYIFADCSPESPKDRRSLCYDDKALNDRKEHKPKGSARALAREMGIELMTEEEYRHLQSLGEFDLKTSSWLRTPDRIRNLGGAIFGDRRFDTVFVYHNGAESYYAARGFRGVVRV